MTTSFQSRAAAFVRAGFEAQTAGDLQRAEAAYREALQLHAEQPDALQLLGMLMRQRGDVQGAEASLRRSLTARPAQPHVWNNLGNLLNDAGRWQEAEAAFDRAIVLHAAYVDAHYNRARVLRSVGRLQDAQAGVLRALAHAAQPTPQMLQLRSQIEADLGDVPAALATINDALAIATDRPALLHNLGTLLQRSHRHAEALQAHDRALALGLNVADAHYNRGNTLQSLGRLQDAVEAYRRALALQPLHRLALFDLARLRWRTGDADFDAELTHACNADATSAVGPGLLAQLLWRAERYADAAAAFAEAIRRSPADAAFHGGWARCQVRLGNVDAGLAAHAHAVALAPGDATLHTEHAASLLIARRWHDAAAAAQRARECAPADQYALAIHGLAWRLLDDPREAVLNDYRRFVRVFQLAPPAGFDSMQAFAAALAQELQTLHPDSRAPIDQTLRCGTQTFGDILEQRHPLVDALKGRLSKAIDAYIADLQEDDDHPFLRRKAARWRYADSWSSQLRSGGFHTNHVHPHGWLSSVFYVGVPEAAGDTARREGWLQFGQPDIDTGLHDAVRLQIQPHPGRLVLFPSMFWHGTSPFRDDKPRLTLAFDVLPVALEAS